MNSNSLYTLAVNVANLRYDSFGQFLKLLSEK